MTTGPSRNPESTPSDIAAAFVLLYNERGTMPAITADEIFAICKDLLSARSETGCNETCKNCGTQNHPVWWECFKCGHSNPVRDSAERPGGST